MALDPDEATRAYDHLTRVLYDMSLQWVAEQAADRIRQGRMDQKRIESFEENLSNAGPHLRRSRRKELRVSIVPYSPEQKLTILVDAIDQAIVLVNDLEQANLKWAQAENRTAVSFLPDPEAGEPDSQAEFGRRELHLDPAKASVRSPANEKLRGLLRELRQDLPRVD